MPLSHQKDCPAHPRAAAGTWGGLGRGLRGLWDQDAQALLLLIPGRNFSADTVLCFLFLPCTCQQRECAQNNTHHTPHTTQHTAGQPSSPPSHMTK